MFDLYSFIERFITRKFHLTTVFVSSHKLWYVVLLHASKHFLISLLVFFDLFIVQEYIMSFPNIYKFSDIHSAFVSWFHSIVWRKESWYDFNFKFVKTCFVRDCYMYIWEECMFCCCWMAFSLFLLGLVWYMVFKSPDSLLIICVDTVSTIEYGVSSIQFISVQLLSRIRLFVTP